MNTALTAPTTVLERLLAALRRRTHRRLDPPAPWRLAADATLWIERPLGRSVRCETGTLWLTFDGEPQDLFLGPGQSLSCAVASRLGIHAMSAARFTLL